MTKIEALIVSLCIVLQFQIGAIFIFLNRHVDLTVEAFTMQNKINKDTSENINLVIEYVEKRD